MHAVPLGQPQNLMFLAYNNFNYGCIGEKRFTMYLSFRYMVQKIKNIIVCTWALFSDETIFNKPFTISRSWL